MQSNCRGDGSMSVKEYECAGKILGRSSKSSCLLVESVANKEFKWQDSV